MEVAAAKKKGEEEGCARVMLILFVEYHRAFRESATYMLDREADLTVVAQGGSVAEGREKMAEGGIDTAIVDIPLPDEGAEELVRVLHEANPSIPVLVMTHLKDREVRPRFLEAGASEVIPKSTTLEEILAAVKNLGGEA
jgi:DNA-binding NarL/FixJ family response regulator